MLIIDNKTKTITFNRGDEVDFIFHGFISENEEKYKFVAGDKITFKIYNKNKYNEEPLLIKNFIIEAEETEDVEISLTKADTKFCQITNKPQTFNYEVILNNKYTMLGYDNSGNKSIVVNPSEKGE